MRSRRHYRTCPKPSRKEKRATRCRKPSTICRTQWTQSTKPQNTLMKQRTRRKEDNMANYIREWNNMARCYNPFDCPFKAAHQGTTERRCTLEEDCVSKDKKATYNYVKKNEGYVVLNEKQRAKQAASMTGHELDQKIEAAKQLLNQLEELGNEFDLKETIKEVHKCIDIYTKERDQRKEAGTWKEWGV